VFHRQYVRTGEKGGGAVGTTKRGKGTKLMAVADSSGLPLAVSVTSASPHEVTLVEQALESRFVDEKPKRLIGDRANDAELKCQGIEMIAPRRRRRRKPKTQDGRKLRRYKRRWKVERLFAWLGSFRRLVVRYERRVDNFLGFVHLACIVILLRQLLG
jgi:transposase